MRTYQISFRTNLDSHKHERWPQHFSESMLPRIGECVQAKSGKQLYVVGIVHKEADHDGDSSHIVEVELNYSS